MIQQEQQEQVIEQQSQQSPYYQPTIMSSEKADLFDKIKPEDTVELIKYSLMGYEFDRNKMEWVYNKEFASKALTKLGAWQIASLMLPVSSKNVTISKLTDGEIRERVKYIIRTAMKMCLRNWKEYGISSPEQIFFVKEIILSNSFITLKQPENAGVRTFIQGTTQENRIVQEQPKQGGFLSSVFRR